MSPSLRFIPWIFYELTFLVTLGKMLNSLTFCYFLEMWEGVEYILWKDWASVK